MAPRPSSETPNKAIVVPPSGVETVVEDQANDPPPLLKLATQLPGVVWNGPFGPV